MAVTQSKAPLATRKEPERTQTLNLIPFQSLDSKAPSTLRTRQLIS